MLAGTCAAPPGTHVGNLLKAILRGDSTITSGHLRTATRREFMFVFSFSAATLISFTSVLLHDQ